MLGQTLLCSSVLRTCTWKIVFKIENNELNELSECIFYKMFFFSGKHLKIVKITFTIIFQKPCFLTLKVSKTLNTCLLALLYFSLKTYKTLISYLLRSYKTSQNFFCLLDLSCLKSFLKPFTNILL